MPPRLNRRYVSKTADYTVSVGVDQAGTIFTNRGATGAVVFTLPTIAQGQHIGLFYEFEVRADQSITVAVPTVDTAIAFNDAAADSIALSTASQKLGGLIRASWDGYAWMLLNLSNNTLTVNT
jgi:hypothetical protein